MSKRWESKSKKDVVGHGVTPRERYHKGEEGYNLPTMNNKLRTTGPHPSVPVGDKRTSRSQDNEVGVSISPRYIVIKRLGPEIVTDTKEDLHVLKVNRLKTNRRTGRWSQS